MELEFIEACHKEIKSNDHKGDWDEWKPTTKELSMEMAWHYAKFTHALLDGDKKRIKEYSCDMAMYCEKAFIVNNTIEKYDDKCDIDYDNNCNCRSHFNDDELY